MLKSGLAVITCGLNSYKQSWANVLQTPLDHNALKSYIDLLIPEDEMPGALSVGADEFILQKAQTDQIYAKALSKGVYWLNYAAKKLHTSNFSTLPLSSQMKLVTYTEQSRMATLPNLFYLMLREDVFSYYYAHPQVLKYFYYARPPQPMGFLDFASPPVSKHEN